MENTDPNIEEKLVPFVEGALAEADRREVLAALPGQPALNQEVRLLRETISSLRMMAAKGLTYQSPVEIQSEQVVDYALQGEQWSRQATRQFQLHLLESPDVAEEIAILRELEGELQQRVESTAAVPEMPASLRQAFQESYGRAPSDPAWKKSLVALAAWLATLNVKVAAAAAAGLAVIVGGIGLGRYAHHRVQGAPAQVAVASPSSAPTPFGSATPTSAPAGQVALLPSKVLPEELPRISRLLWQKQVSHSYRDGQIFVAQADLDRAWSALSVNEKVAAAQPLKTGPAPADKKTNLLDGIIGALPDAKAPSPAATAKTQPSKDNKPPATSKPTAAMPAVAIALPGEPAPSGADANYQVPQSQAPAQPAYQAAEPAGERREENRGSEPYAAPSQPEPARPVLPPQSEPPRVEPKTPVSRVPRKKVAEPPKPPQARTGVFGQTRSNSAAPTAPPIREAEVAVAPIPEPMQPAQPIDPVRKPATTSPAQQSYSQAENKGTQGPASETTGKSSPSQVNLKVDIKDEEDPPGPAPQQVALESPKAKPSAQAQVQTGLAGGVPGAASNDLDRDFNRRPKPVAAVTSSNNSGGEGFRARSDNFEVSADAPFEVAMLPVAKKLVEDSIGEAKVQMERKEDNHLLVTIRPARNLTPQEVEKLRKLVREKLQLADEDTVVIRQP